jgi:hypothetical protein
MKIINVQAKRKDCGSEASNLRDRNKAIMANETGPEFRNSYGFPIKKDCYDTFISGKLEDNYLYNGKNKLGQPMYTPYTFQSSMINGGWGLINMYPNNGFSKVVKLDYSDQKEDNYFFDMI